MHIMGIFAISQVSQIRHRSLNSEGLILSKHRSDTESITHSLNLILFLLLFFIQNREKLQCVFFNSIKCFVSICERVHWRHECHRFVRMSGGKGGLFKDFWGITWFFAFLVYFMHFKKVGYFVKVQICHITQNTDDDLCSLDSLEPKDTRDFRHQLQKRHAQPLRRYAFELFDIMPTIKTCSAEEVIQALFGSGKFWILKWIFFHWIWIYFSPCDFFFKECYWCNFFYMHAKML